MATIKLEKVGYAQCEPNKISAQRTKEIFGMLPLADEVTLCEQGMVLIYDDIAGKVRYMKAADEDSNALYGLVYSEIILEDERKQADTDFALMNFPATKIQGEIKAYPRLFALTKGDIFTTNAIAISDGKTLPEVGTTFKVGADGYWVADAALDMATVQGPVLKLKAKTTMPDGQLGAKFVVVRA